jgi:PAS domain S-box-containing protein
MDGYFKRVSPSFMRTLGYTEAELLSRPIVSFIHPDEVTATQGEIRRHAAGDPGATREFQNRYRCADGTFRWIAWRSQADMSQGRIYAAGRDVTEHKALAQKLAEYTTELERSNAELQQFAYVASHDLQEPLRAVAGCVQMLAERNANHLDERSAELMRYAIDGAKRMQTLINDLLDYSRVGNKGIKQSWVEIGSSVDKALKFLYVAVTDNDARITLIEPLPRVWADSTQLTQLFQNLISNAIKFRVAARPEIRIQSEQAGDDIIISVSDNGIGIAPEYHERIFGIFQRLHSHSHYAGNGIGLAICKKIVERHGGRIWIESTPGNGASFKFTLPKKAD